MGSAAWELVHAEASTVSRVQWATAMKGALAGGGRAGSRGRLPPGTPFLLLQPALAPCAAAGGIACAKFLRQFSVRAVEPAVQRAVQAAVARAPAAAAAVAATVQEQEQCVCERVYRALPALRACRACQQEEDEGGGGGGGRDGCGDPIWLEHSVFTSMLAMAVRVADGEAAAAASAASVTVLVGSSSSGTEPGGTAAELASFLSSQLVQGNGAVDCDAFCAGFAVAIDH